MKRAGPVHVLKLYTDYVRGLKTIDKIEANFRFENPRWHWGIGEEPRHYYPRRTDRRADDSSRRVRL